MGKRRSGSDTLSVTKENQEQMINDLFGNIGNLNNLPTQIMIPLPHSSLNAMTDGGLMSGTVSLWTGPSGCYKTTIALQTLGKFIEMYPESWNIILDVEATTTLKREASFGISREKNSRLLEWHVPITFENISEIFEKFMQIKTASNTVTDPSFILLDSLDMAQTEKENEADDPDQAVGRRAKFIKFFLRKYNRFLRQYNVHFMIISHVTKEFNMDRYATYNPTLSTLGDWSIGGGKSVQYVPATMIFLMPRLMASLNKTTEDNEDFASYKFNVNDRSAIIQACTLKCKNIESTHSSYLVIDPRTGVTDLPTKIWNMVEKDKFTGQGQWRELKGGDFKFQRGTLVEKYNSDEKFRLAFESNWTTYLQEKYSSVMEDINYQIEEISQQPKEEIQNAMEFVDMDETEEDVVPKQRKTKKTKEGRSDNANEV